MIESFGHICYRDDWHIYLNCDHELGKYLRKLYSLARRNVEKLGRPSRNEHITVVSNYEKNENFELLWRKYEGDKVNFILILEPQTNGNAFWFPVISQQLNNLRIELGLPEIKNPRLHFCCGYLYQGKFHDDLLKI